MAAYVYADAFVPEVWDASIMRTLEDNLIARKICRNYSNKVKGAGDTIYFNGLADPTVSDYDGSISYENLVSGTVALLVDQQDHYAFDVSDIEQAMANVDLKGSQAARAAYALKKACDTKILKLYSEAGNTATPDTTCKTTTIFSDIAEMKQLLAENNVPENDMFLVIPPWVQVKLELAGIAFKINEGINGKGGMMFTKIMGFDTYVTNQIYESVSTPVSHLLAGSYEAIGFAESLNINSEVLRAETAFTNHVRGLHVYGYKVLKPKELCTITLTYNAETAI